MKAMIRLMAVAIVALAGLIGAPLVMADATNDAYQTGSGDGYYSLSGVGQGTFPSAFVNGLEDGYDFCWGNRVIHSGTILTIAWMLPMHGPDVARQLTSQKPINWHSAK